MQTEPETITQEEATATAAAVTPPVRELDPWLDPVADYLKGGAMPAARIVAQVFHNPEPDAESIAAMDRRLASDPRFHLLPDGSWDLMGLPPAINTTAKVEPVEGVGSEQQASETPPPAEQIAALIMDAGAETIARLKEENERLRDELRAHKEREAAEKDAADKISQCTQEVEAAKKVLAGKKAALAEAHLELVAVVTGGSQTSHPDLTGEDDEDEDGEQAADFDTSHVQIQDGNGQPGTTAAVTSREYAVAPDQVLLPEAHGLDLMRLRAVLRRDLPPSEKPLQIGPAVVEIKACLWLVVDVNGEETRWFALRVLTKDEWQQLHEAAFGRCVEGFDQNQEAKDTRTAGGELCGRVFRMGRKLVVIGPEKEGLVLLLTASEPAKVINGADAFDAKAAAAGDARADDAPPGE